MRSRIVFEVVSDHFLINVLLQNPNCSFPSWSPHICVAASLRLSYHQRIVDIVPPTFSALIPANPIFTYKYEDETACEDGSHVSLISMKT